MITDHKKHFGRLAHAEEAEMQQEINNWDGNDITTLPFVSKEKSIGHKIEEAVRPLLQNWVNLRKQQQEKQQEIEEKLKQDTPHWNELLESQRDNKIIKQRVNDKNWCELNTKLFGIQKQITDKVVEISHDTGQIKKPINNNFIFPIYNKYGGKARSEGTYKNIHYDKNGSNKYYKSQKQNKPNIYIQSKPDVIKKIQKEHNVKTLKGLIDYFDKQPKDTNTYSNEEIKEIIMYAKRLILRNISKQKTIFRNITSDQTRELSADIRGKLDPTRPYTFEQMVDTIKTAHTTYKNKILASKLINNNNQIQPANNANNQVENQQANNANNQVENQQANNIINNQAEQMDLLADIPLEDVLVEEIENKNRFNDPFDLDFDMISNPEINHNQEYNINGNNENFFPTNTINNDISTINNIEKLNIHFITKGK